MQISKALRILGVFAAILLLPIGKAYSQKAILSAPQPPASDPFEISLGYNYIHLGDAYPENANLHGVDLSFFYNFTSRIALGGDFMANFGKETHPFFFGNVDVDSQRYLYVFGPRFTIWSDQRFRIFAEALAGGVHAEAQVHFGSIERTAHEDAFAMAVGGGFDWRFAPHWSWRVVQVDYLPTTLGDDWQNNVRASTGIVFSFGGGR